MDFQSKAKELVALEANKRLDVTDNIEVTTDQVYVVWFSKTLQNWKALLSTTLPDGMYYEVTFNGDSHEAYVDSYRKLANSTYLINKE